MKSWQQDLLLILFTFSWYLKKDLSEEIFRLIVFEEALFSLSEASQVRDIEAVISFISLTIYSKSTKSKNAVRSFLYEVMVCFEYLF